MLSNYTREAYCRTRSPTLNLYTILLSVFVDMRGVEPLRRMYKIHMLTVTSHVRLYDKSVISGRQGNRTLTTRRWTCLANKLDKPIFDYLPNSVPWIVLHNLTAGCNLIHSPTVLLCLHAPKASNPDRLGWNQTCFQLHQGRVLLY